MMKKKSFKAIVAAALMGTMLQGCVNWNRILGSVVDHTFYAFVEPFITDLTGSLTGGT